MNSPRNVRQTVEEWLTALRPSLPIQNPLWAFVHNNILLNDESLTFHEAARQAAALYRARPYEAESFYRAQLQQGRLHRASLEAVLHQTLPGVTVDQFLDDVSLGEDVAPVVMLRRAAIDPEYDRRLQDVVVPVISAWLDQGMAAWRGPYREGLWAFFCEGIAVAPRWSTSVTHELRTRLTNHQALGRDADAVIVAEVTAAAPAGQEVPWCREVLFALKGWSGMVARLEADPAAAPVEAPPASLRDWLAVMLVCSHALDAALCLSMEPGASPTTLHLGRLKRFHEAYERTFAVEFINHLSPQLQPQALRIEPEARPEFQVLACMDDREESLRRALEAQGVETIGTLGFFGVDMRFEALGSGRPTRQCPPVIEPSRSIREHPVGGDAMKLARQRRLGRSGWSVMLALFFHSRSLVRGFLVSMALGLVSFLPLLFKLMWPARVAQWRLRLVRWAFPKAKTRLQLDDDGGYSVDEQAHIVEGLLRAAGLTSNFAPVVVAMGHGSTSTNNPFRQAYGCGACSGNPGAPNARAFAQMANTPAVRARMAYRGLVIPDDTTFVPAFHDTALSAVELLDTEHMSPEVAAKMPALATIFKDACRLDASERAARFAQAPAGGTEACVQHVMDRGHDLAQPRPEYGHNRVAACIVGRRSLTEPLFLDRRCFLVSYDPTQDKTGEQLPAAVLGSVPVAVNIAMDYYFSRVDSDGFGAGSKLPLNVVSLLGVMTGSKSDLRIGLARQMVELHEPMRMLVLLEATEAHVQSLISGNARMQRMVHNGWMRLGRIDPTTRKLTMWTPEGFVYWRAVFPEEKAMTRTALPPIFDAAHDTLLEIAA